MHAPKVERPAATATHPGAHIGDLCGAHFEITATHVRARRKRRAATAGMERSAPQSNWGDDISVTTSLQGATYVGDEGLEPPTFAV